MPRLPQPGSDAGSWGDILNDYLSQSHKQDGTLKDNIITDVQIANSSVTATLLANNSVQTTALADGSVTTPKLSDGSVTSEKLDPSILLGGVVADGSISTSKLADSAVTNIKLDTATRTSLYKADTASQPGHTHAVADVTNLQATLDGKQPTGSYALTSLTVAGHPLSSDVTITPADIGAATTAQGAKADSAVQSGSLATVATTGAYTDLSARPSLGDVAGLNIGTTAGTVAAGDDARITASVPSTRTVAGHPLSSDVIITPADIGAATAAQGAKADTAVQPAGLPTWTTLTGKPTFIAAGADQAAARNAIGAAAAIDAGIMQSIDLAFSGTVVPRVGTLGWMAPFAITVLGMSVHWVDAGTSVLVRVNSDGGAIITQSVANGYTDLTKTIAVGADALITADVVTVTGTVVDMVVHVWWIKA